MEKLIEQLQSNTEALNTLEERRWNTNTSTYWTRFKSIFEQRVELKWIDKIEKRVLRMRYTILENIKREALHGMNKISNDLRELNLKAA